MFSPTTIIFPQPGGFLQIFDRKNFENSKSFLNIAADFH